MRLRHRWLKKAMLLPMGITISEVDDASDSCLFFKGIMTRYLTQCIPFDRPQEQLYWWLRQSKANGLFRIDVGPRYLLERTPLGYPPLVPGFPRMFKDEVPHDVYAIEGMFRTLCIHWV
jgi:hypothetical protein